MKISQKKLLKILNNIDEENFDEALEIIPKENLPAIMKLIFESEYVKEEIEKKTEKNITVKKMSQKQIVLEYFKSRRDKMKFIHPSNIEINTLTKMQILQACRSLYIDKVLQRNKAKQYKLK